jgi:RNA polymerase sigma-70 factor, ECF subfamily
MGLRQLFSSREGERSAAVSSATLTPTGDDPETEQLRGEVTELLQQIADGHQAAAELLLPMIYDELRRIARSFMRRERENHTLQPTALVHEAYLRMLGQNRVSWQSRGHFLSIAATMMRRILVDSSRQHLRVKRGGGAEHRELVDSDVHVAGGAISAVDILALNKALERLAERDPRMVKVVELRFFAGLDVEETAQALGISAPTVKRDWSVARAWLARDLGASADV